MKNRSIYLVAAMSIIFFFPGCKPQQKNAKEILTPEAIPVKVSRLDTGEINQVLEYVGDIRGQEEAVVYPKTSGKVSEKVKEEGAFVKKGEPVVYLDRDEVGLTFEKVPVLSPLDGFIGRMDVDIGTHVSAITPVARVVDMEKVEIIVDVAEIHLAKIALAQTATVAIDAYPNQEFRGSVSEIAPLVDLGTRSAEVKISVDNQDHRLKSGMFARVKLMVERRKDVTMVLKEAVIGKPPQQYAFVVKDNLASLRKITLGIRQGSYYEVTQGLDKGDLVVIMGQQRLSEGALVQIEADKF